MNSLIKDKYFILLILLLVILSTNLWQVLNKETLGTVDIQQIISSQAETLAISYPKGNVPEVRLQQLIDHLQKTLETYAQKNRLTLFPKGLVLSGIIPDYTATFLEQLKEIEE